MLATRQAGWGFTMLWIPGANRWHRCSKGEKEKGKRTNMWNTMKTTLLLATLTGLLVLAGNALGGTTGMIIGFTLALVMNGGAYWFSDKLALRMSGAREVSPAEAPQLHAMVSELAARAELPKPRVYIIDSPVPNAFATGRNPQNGAVAATTGIMQVLNQRELAGVMAHELAHIKNRDTLISAVAATIAGAITMIAEFAQWSLIFSGLSGNSDEEEGGWGGFIGSLLMIILAPIAAMLIQMAISRSREYKADEVGARIAGDPLGLASALQRIEAFARGGMQLQANPATAHQYIINPLAGGLGGLFSTHPATEERIARLRRMAGQSVDGERMLA
jgi:heat shock protein HtpX